MGKSRHRSAVLAFATVLGVAAPMTLYAAGARYLEPANTPADAMPAYEIVTRVREMALEPASRPMRRGSYYVLHAYDRRGVEMRVVADAQLGDILSVTPVRSLAAAYAPLSSGPRIIHVPGPEDEQVTAEPSDAPDAAPPDDAEDVAPPPRARTQALPRRDPFTSAPKPAEHRAVLSAPPPQANADTLTPIYPTPKFSREDKAEKFTASPPASAPIPHDEVPSQ